MKSKSEKAFTLIELLVVIAVIGLISTISVAYLIQSRTRAKDTARIAEIEQIRKILNVYIDDNFYLPPPGGGTVCYRSDNTAEWNTLAGLLKIALPVDVENMADYRYAFFRSDEALNGCLPSPHCGWVMTKKQQDDKIVIVPIFKGNYTTGQAAAEWSATCGGGIYTGYEEY